MALQKHGLNLNRVSKELQPHGTIEFPCAAYTSFHTERQEDMIPWHWHDEIELVYMAEGRMNVKTSSESFLLERGDMVAINSNILHSASAVGECRLCSLVFSPLLVAGNVSSVYAKKYIQPLISCHSFSGLFLGKEMKNPAVWFGAAFESLMQESRGFEFTVRENLSRICFYLYEQYEQQIAEKGPKLNQDDLRIRRMLAFIHKNFADNLSLADISNAADISERECMRCFQKTIQISPIQYLLKCRIMQGAEMLLGEQGKSISEIAMNCGFNSPSNFTKFFRRYYNCTPREYRQRHIE